jgi:hypothetical protein
VVSAVLGSAGCVLLSVAALISWTVSFTFPVMQRHWATTRPWNTRPVMPNARAVG